MMHSDVSAKVLNKKVASIVLILVLMDDALRHVEACCRTKDGLRVLILVLMDDALRLIKAGAKSVKNLKS